MPTSLRDQIAIAVGAEPGRGDAEIADSLMPIIDHHVAHATQCARTEPQHVWELMVAHERELPHTVAIRRTAAEAMGYADDEQPEPGALVWVRDGRNRLCATDSDGSVWMLKVAWL